MAAASFTWQRTDCTARLRLTGCCVNAAVPCSKISCSSFLSFFLLVLLSVFFNALAALPLHLFLAAVKVSVLRDGV